jgi:predicted ribosome quality control (RQC) complex YloA/Tae2 family protein
MVEEADSEMERTQRDLTKAIKDNTALLDMIRKLGEEQLDLNRKLDSTNKAIFVDEDDELKRNMLEEKEKLKKLLELQAKEIETLKTEINLYKKKGGHIYTKVTTNRRVANLNHD